MKFLLSVALTALIAFVAGLWSPWWSLAVAAFVAALFVRQSAPKAFLSGFTGIFILWAILAWWIDMQNMGILSKKIALVLPLSGNSFLLILITAIVGGLVGAFSAATGALLVAARRNSR